MNFATHWGMALIWTRRNRLPSDDTASLLVLESQATAIILLVLVFWMLDVMPGCLVRGHDLYVQV